MYTSIQKKVIQKQLMETTLQCMKMKHLAIVGESGCGKSVTAMSILGLVSEPGEIMPGIKNRIYWEMWTVMKMV